MFDWFVNWTGAKPDVLVRWPQLWRRPCSWRWLGSRWRFTWFLYAALRIFNPQIVRRFLWHRRRAKKHRQEAKELSISRAITRSSRQWKNSRIFFKPRGPRLSHWSIIAGKRKRWD